MNIVPRQVQPSQLLLDPNNYRFHDLPGYKSVSRARFAEQGVQDKALQYLRDTTSFDLGALRDSIVSNGFVRIEQIVVESMGEEAGTPSYLVVEGNRRTAAIKMILQDQDAGALDLTSEILATLRDIPVVELTGTKEERAQYQKTLMAIRHVAGIKAWGSYQQAKLVVDMFDNEDHAFSRVAQRIGISSQEVGRRYRASKALAQMEDDEEFGAFAKPKLYAFFHEAVSQPIVRNWLNFSDETYRAEDPEARRLFYELLSPREVDGETLPPKLVSANTEVRQLKDIVNKPLPLRILADPTKSFDDAVKAAEAESPQDETGVLEHQLGIALRALRTPSIDAWLNPNERSKQLWHEIVGLVEKSRRVIEGQ